MAKKTAYDAFLTECEPYFLDGAHTIAQFAQRTQAIVRKAVEHRWDSLVEALGFTENEATLVDYCDPDKLQKAKSTDGVSLGVKIKVSDLFEAGIYKYWLIDVDRLLHRRGEKGRRSEEIPVLSFQWHGLTGCLTPAPLR
jgi:hypothetical protein